VNGRIFARLLALAAAAALMLGACGTTLPSAGPTPRPTAGLTVSAATTAAALATAAPTPTASPSRNPCSPFNIDPNGIGSQGQPGIRWYVGLGSESNAAQVVALQKVVTDYNALQARRAAGKQVIPLALEIVRQEDAASILQQELDSGNAPDLIGPITLPDRDTFAGEFMDLGPLLATAGLDTSAYPAGLLDGLRDGPTGPLLGLPFGFYPSFIVYDKDLFDAAGLAYPPSAVGQKYVLDGSPVAWNWSTVRTLAMRMSLDKYGQNAMANGFDRTRQTQFGFDFEGADGRRLGDAFGAGTLTAPDGKAQFPGAWRAGWQWYFDAIWKDHFLVTDAQRYTGLLDYGDPISSGHVAMAYPLQLTPMPGSLKHWDIAPMPAGAQGRPSAPLTAITIGLDKSSCRPELAFDALRYIVGRDDLRAVYGAVPATGDGADFYRTRIGPRLAASFPGNKVNWQMALDMEKYAPALDQPPLGVKASADLDQAFATLSDSENLDMNTTIAMLVAAMQEDANAAP
jgi:multiple sugar transport system substrate-binding protein